MRYALFAISAMALLAACTEQPQAIGSNARVDQRAFQGTGQPFAAPGWKPGDQASWEQHMKTRTQNQNDFARVN